MNKKIRTGAYVLLTCAVLGLSFIAWGKDDTSFEQTTATAAVLTNFPPQYIAGEDGSPAGFAVDVMNAVADIAGLRVNYLIVDTWDEMFEAVKSGKADLIPNLGITDERRKWFAFTAPVETFPVSIFVRKASGSIEGEQALGSQRVGAIN